MHPLAAFLPPLPPALAALRGAARGAVTRRARRPASSSRHAGAGKASSPRSPFARAAEARRAVAKSKGGGGASRPPPVSGRGPSAAAGTGADATAAPAAAPAARRGRRAATATRAAPADAPGAVDWTPRGGPRPAAAPGGGARGALSNVGALAPVIQWYPGHIAKAERSLRATLKLVDVVVEVRDCRIPLATAHPDVAAWVGSKGRVLVMNRADSVPEAARADWRRYYWVRLADDLELLDMPGIIPAKLVSQDTAVRLALCDDIGTAAYDNQVMAAALVTELSAIAERRPGYVDLAVLERRYKVPVADHTGEAYLHAAAEQLYRGDLHRMSVRMLNDFRGGLLGPIGLEAPPSLFGEGDDAP
ncbi:hypothetical protein I4F81_010023 [Pyropia yezoensis]|uniref:Uncharacterized protein n=1 Tax=Pyropia yezoensis TaxID=2788 RepID=A0ACC3CCN7_PYRYE|nr:hypothetical protein I4F81_010023 [Neopyropia yezoensis]